MFDSQYFPSTSDFFNAVVDLPDIHLNLNDVAEALPNFESVASLPEEYQSLFAGVDIKKAKADFYTWQNNGFKEIKDWAARTAGFDFDGTTLSIEIKKVVKSGSEKGVFDPFTDPDNDVWSCVAVVCVGTLLTLGIGLAGGGPALALGAYFLTILSATCVLQPGSVWETVSEWTSS